MRFAVRPLGGTTEHPRGGTAWVVGDLLVSICFRDHNDENDPVCVGSLDRWCSIPALRFQLLKSVGLRFAWARAVPGS